MNALNRKRENILILTVAGIGDLIMASRSLRAMRNGFPDAHLHLLTGSEAAPIAANYPYLDTVWSFPIRESRNKRFRTLSACKPLLRLRDIRLDTAVNLYRVVSYPGALKMALLFAFLRARTKIGHDAMGFGFCLDRKVGKEAFTNRHFVDAMMDIALAAGGVADDGGIEVFWDKRVERGLEHLFGQSAEALGIGINPGADRPQKRWDPHRYAWVADRLAEELNARILIFGGPGEEPIASAVQEAMKHPATNLAGRFNLDELACVLRRLDLLITNDSGPMHIAAALKTPVVALFGPEDPVYTKPYTSPDKYRIVQSKVPCRPCTRKKCDKPVCMEMVKPEEVLGACLELMSLRRFERRE